MKRMKLGPITRREYTKSPYVGRPIPRPPKSGTVYTPHDLANTVVSALQVIPGLTWLEPCIGEGALLRALHNAGVEPQQITGLDLDTTHRETDRLCHQPALRGMDFLDWAQSKPKLFDRIVANPPYVALSKIPARLLDTALKTKDPDGKAVRAGANYWFAFLCASLSLLKFGGSLAFILPAAWDYADYAGPLRKRLVDLFSLVEVHRCRKPMFNHVRDGCIVLIARGFGTAGKRFKRYEYESPQRMIEQLPSSRSRESVYIKPQGIRLGDVVDIKLGGVTGDARYFLLTDAQRKEHNLPEVACVPVLSKARHIKTGHITRTQWEKLKEAGNRVWLFRPTEEALDHPAVEKYYNYGKKGGCNLKAFKIKSRKEWHQTPMPKNTHGFITGMSQHGVWCCLNEMPGLNATNTLYTVTFKQAITPDEQAAWSMALLFLNGQKFLSSLGRQYPDGLRKFEPGDLLNLSIPKPIRIKDAHISYLEAVAKLTAGDACGANLIASQWVSPMHIPDSTKRISVNVPQRTP